MGTKNNPGKYDCYASAEPDEPVFVLLGRDPMAPVLVRLWAELREINHEDIAKVEEARACAHAMWMHLEKLGKRPINSYEAERAAWALREGTPSAETKQ